MEHYESHHKEVFGESALEVAGGIEQPPVVNPHYRRG